MVTTYPANRGDHDGSQAKGKDGKILDRILKRHDYMVRAWKAHRDESDKDMKSLSLEGPWDTLEKEAREQLNRPALHLDQISQYVNGFVGEMKQSPIGIKVDPTGHGANEETAELRQDRIRQIEYENDATMCYLNALEDAVKGGDGYFGILIEDLDWDRFEKKITFRQFSNHRAVLIDPDFKKPDASDILDAFVITHYSFEDFKRKFPKAQVTDFKASNSVNSAPEWFDMDREVVQVAEYWYVETKKRELFLVEDHLGVQERLFREDLKELSAQHGGDFSIRPDIIEFKDGYVLTLLRKKDAPERKVYQCVTNGVEVLEKTEWPGKWIPVVPVLGKECYVKNGSKLERVFESYIRHARAGQMLFDFYVSAEAESVGLIPKTGYLGYEGQFETNTPWEQINKIPVVTREVKAQTAESDGQLLPLPRFDAYEAPIQAIEIGKEAARRSIQAALGNFGFSKLDDTNVKSGIALERLENSADVASYHLVYNYKAAVRHAGRIVNDLLEVIEDEPQEVAVRRQNDTREIVKINEPYYDESGQEITNQYSREPGAMHDVTISDGPSYQSQREAASEFVDNFIRAFAGIPQIIQMTLPFLIRLKNLGPIGDELADMVTPPQMKKAEEMGVPPQIMQQMMQMKQMIDAQNQAIQKYEMEKQAKVTEKTLDGQIKQMQAMFDENVKRMELASKEAVAVMEQKYKAAIEAEKLTSAENLAHLSAGAAQAATQVAAPGPAE